MKVLTEEDIKWKGKEYYESLKPKFNRGKINALYEKTYRQPYSIGYVSKLFRRLKPCSYEDGYNKYLKSGYDEINQERKFRGRTVDELEDLAIKWKEESHSRMPVSMFYDALILHAVVETVYGNIMEGRAEEIYRRHGFEIIESSEEDDRNGGIDFIAKKGEQTLLVQVKPHTFFYNKEDIRKDRVSMYHKMEYGIEKYPGATYAIMIYNKKEEWLSKDGRFNFRYSELTDINGISLVNVDEMTGVDGNNI